MDLLKVKKVKNWPTPTTTKIVQQFLGFAGYYQRFLTNCAVPSLPHQMRKTFQQECQDTFEKLCHCLTSALALVYPDYNQLFILDMDASNIGIGAVLSQLDKYGRELVIAYAS